MIHATNKTLHELGDKVTSDERSKIETAISELKTAMNGDDKAEIERKTEHLTELSGKLAERLYAQKSETAGSPGAEPEPAAEAKSGEDVVDAEFEEVKEDRK
jgi:molecular chaperone DnaK